MQIQTKKKGLRLVCAVIHYRHDENIDVFCFCAESLIEFSFVSRL